MFLFQCVYAKPRPVDPAIFLPTPLGRVRLEATLGQENVSGSAPTATYRLQSGGWLARWEREDFRLELLVCHPQIPASLSRRMAPPLTDCWAGVWRLEALADLEPCLFAAVWEERAEWQQNAGNSGEWVYASTWDDGHTEVTISTQDEEILASRARRNDYLPTAWFDFFYNKSQPDGRFTSPYWQHEAHGDLLDIGVPTPTPGLRTGQRCQIHYIVAWADYQKDSITTWLAGDCTITDILAGTSCS